MTTASKGDIAVIDFTVTTNDGRTVGGTEKEGPMTLTLGIGNIFPQVEEALIGLSAGDEIAVTVPAAQAFGARREELVIAIPRANMPPEPEPKPGMRLEAKAPDGQALALTIIEVNETAVRADGNHPLAGEDLHFKVTLAELRPAG